MVIINDVHGICTRIPSQFNPTLFVIGSYVMVTSTGIIPIESKKHPIDLNLEK
jgi:hypothetical protein